MERALPVFIFCAQCGEPFQVRYANARQRCCSVRCGQRKRWKLGNGRREEDGDRIVLHPASARESAMLLARFGGETLENIATEHGVTRERVRQLLARYGTESRHSRKILSRQIRTQQTIRGWKQKDRRKARRRERVEQARAYLAEHGSLPSQMEWYKYPWGSYMTIGRLFDPHIRGARGSRRGVRRFLRLVGAPTRKPYTWKSPEIREAKIAKLRKQA